MFVRDWSGHIAHPNVFHTESLNYSQLSLATFFRPKNFVSVLDLSIVG